VIPETIGFEVSISTVRYFVQPIDGSKPPLQLYENREQGNGGNGTMLADGAALLSTMRRLVWAKAGEAPRGDPVPSIDGYDVGAVALYPDGIVGQEYRPGERGERCWWIPTDGHALQMEARVRLDEDVDSPWIFIRSGQRIAWLNAPIVNENTPKAQQRRPTFCTFDVGSGKAERVPVMVDGGSVLAAFDGKHAVAGGKLIDPATGAATQLNISGDVVGIAGDTIYAIQAPRPTFRMQRPDSADIVAAPLNDRGNSRAIAHLDLYKLSGANDHMWVNPKDCVLVTAEGLRIWNGQHWARAK
jgi:hypothetical protein